MSRTEYSADYMSYRRSTNPLQKYQDRKDSLRARMLKARTHETLANCIDEYAVAVLELDAARRLYKTSK